MKPYGHTKRDTLTCQYGCCVSKAHKVKRDPNRAYDKARRKAVRQEGKAVVAQEVE